MKPSAPGSRRGLGQQAEQTAAQWLVRHGFRVIARNWQARGGELDLVGLHRGMLVAVEVRHRHNARFVDPIASVTQRKCIRLVHALQCFVLAHPRYRQLPMRIDIVGVSGDLEQPSIRWIENAITLDELR